MTTSSLTISFYLTISSAWASLFLSPHYLTRSLSSPAPLCTWASLPLPPHYLWQLQASLSPSISLSPPPGPHYLLPPHYLLLAHYLLAHYLLVTIFSSLTISLSGLIISSQPHYRYTAMVELAPMLPKLVKIVSLCPKKAAWCWEKKWGETSAEDCKTYVIFWDIDGSTGLF